MKIRVGGGVINILNGYETIDRNIFLSKLRQ